jgi:hypothetical protein
MAIRESKSIFMAWSTNHKSQVTNHGPCGSGDCFRYAATPMMPDIMALTPAIARVESHGGETGDDAVGAARDRGGQQASPPHLKICPGAHGCLLTLR